MVRSRLVAVAVVVLGLCVLGCGSAADGAERAGDAGDAAAAMSDGEGQRRPIDVNDLGYDRGSPDAPVLVLEFSDFGCPYCSRFALSSLPQIEEEFIHDGVVRWKYVPFVMGMFPNGAEAARASECAAEQGEAGFWAMHDRLYRNQSAWKATSGPRELFVSYARALELDDDAFADCYDSSDAALERINLNNALAARLGVRATPTFFVNGVRVQGALPMEHFRLLLKGAAAQ